MTATLLLALVDSGRSYGEQGLPFVILVVALLGIGGWLLATRPRR